VRTEEDRGGIDPPKAFEDICTYVFVSLVSFPISPF
jgi:hypothetical protein